MTDVRGPVSAAIVALLAAMPAAGHSAAPPRGLLLSGTVVTMDGSHHVLRHGHVLVRGNRIVAVWSRRPPRRLDLHGVRNLRTGAGTLIFPGLIDLHAHPSFSALPLWPPPSSHAQPQFGRPNGTEPYDNRYEWSGDNRPPEQARLVRNAKAALAEPDKLGLDPQLIVYAEAEAALGGETALQGEDPTRASGLIVRDVDGKNFGRDRIDARITAVTDPAGPWGDDRFSTSGDLANGIASHKVDAWIVHLAEGVRDEDLAKNDTFHSRTELDALVGLHLLTSATVVVHGTALERRDFDAMKRAGAKLVWSPLSNLLLYGHTTNVYDAIAAGVPVSLGTDWAPSGSKTLLDELKVADIALHNRRSRALDRELVDMVTRNPAQALRWPEVGSIAAGKHADLLVLGGKPASPYRSLIDATQRDVRLVLVDGKPVAGDPRLVRAAGARSFAIVRSAAGHFTKAVAFRRAAPRSLQLGNVERTLARALRALGGDRAPRASGPPPPARGFAYLKARWDHGADKKLTKAAFHNLLALQFGKVGDRINLERIELTPLFTADDHFFFAVLEGKPADPAPPFKLYPANVNQGNVLKGFRKRWYP